MLLLHQAVVSLAQCIKKEIAPGSDVASRCLKDDLFGTQDLKQLIGVT